jgi:hypothetical protein
MLINLSAAAGEMRLEVESAAGRSMVTASLASSAADAKLAELNNRAPDMQQ